MNEAIADLTSTLMQHYEVLSPVLDQADFIRNSMIERGWSPAYAEAIAGQWLSFAVDSYARDVFA